MLGVAVRLFVRQRHGMADHMSHLPKLMRLAALGVHLALYGLLIGLPLLGWATTNAHSLSVRFLGVIPLPFLAEVDSELADQLSDYHVLGAWMLLGLVGLHTVAALYHHYIRRDTVLWAMLPERADTLVERSPKSLNISVGLPD